MAVRWQGHFRSQICKETAEGSSSNGMWPAYNDAAMTLIVQLIVATFGWFGLIGAVLFLSAGTWDWPEGWAYVGLMIVLSFIIGGALARHDPALLKERMKPPIQEGQPVSDKIATSILFVLVIAWYGFMALDAVRFGWSSVPIWVQGLGVLCLVVWVAIAYRALRENSFLAPVVKIQAERGQRVIDTGPYGHVRHPFYSAILFFFTGTALLLGSWWGLAAALVFIAFLPIRILIEERTLRAGLPGYDAYAARVRWRMIPGVW